MIYLDHNATTYTHPEVRELISDLSLEVLNPSSVHSHGRRAKAIMEEARGDVAGMLGAPLAGNNYSKDAYEDEDYNIVFTASGTEANNIVMNSCVSLGYEPFISPVEHSSVLDSSRFLSVNILKVDSQGVIDLNYLEDVLKKSDADKKLVSVMFANNETGVISPMKEIVSIARKYDAFIHSDIVQAPGKIHINLLDLDLDYATISAHKFGGMTGAGALIYKSDLPLEPMIFGGGQERRIRSGTEAVLNIAAMGRAARIISDKQEFSRRIEHMMHLRNYLENAIEEKLPNSSIIAKDAQRLPNTSLIMTPNKKSEMQLIALDLKGISVSSGSACSSGKLGQSNTLKAMQVKGYDNASVIRVSTSYNTTKDDIDGFIDAFVEINRNE